MIPLVVFAVLASQPLPVVTATVSLHEGSRDCDRCHTPEGWLPARFDHGRVGYALEGRHEEVRCGRCHEADLSAAVPRACAGCHAGPHRGELGARCEGCHDPFGWASRYDAAAHQASAFPLVGGHALVPCEECHQDAYTGGFARAGAACLTCHADDYDAAARTSLDHLQLGFGTDCQGCHQPWSFSQAIFPGHDRCFSTGGDHAGIGCLGCHTSLQGVTGVGSCDTRTAACTSCHEHDRANTDGEHDDVPGYLYEDRRCYECHRFTAD